MKISVRERNIGCVRGVVKRPVNRPAWRAPNPDPGRYRAAVTGVRLLAVGTAVVLATAGCASTIPGTAPSRTVTPGTAGPPVPSGPPLGRPARADNGQVEATVFGYRGPAGTGWAAADVQVCVLASAIFDVTVSQGPWLLVFADGPGTPPSPARDAGLPQPAYPTEHRRLHPGECVRGWLAFPVPAERRPVAVQYSPTGADPITWPLG